MKTATQAIAQERIQYISDQDGKTTGVIVPIELWRELTSARETAYLLSSATMKERLLNAKNRQDGMPFEVVCEKLGI
jgi:hypothetical protein